MIEARAARERELTDLILNSRSKLVAIYEQATGKQMTQTPDVATCLTMIREIIDIELPLDGGA